MKRRSFLKSSFLLGGISSLPVSTAFAHHGKIDKVSLSDKEWKKRLTPKQYDILRDEGTEYPGSSPLNDEKREGIYTCAGCDLPLFESKAKYDSRTGWPSFYEAIPDHMETKTDFVLLYPRKEYHCARCGGHQGHVFKDGPPPTGLRWCNNGYALKFIPKATG